MLRLGAKGVTALTSHVMFLVHRPDSPGGHLNLVPGCMYRAAGTGIDGTAVPVLRPCTYGTGGTTAHLRP